MYDKHWYERSLSEHKKKDASVVVKHSGSTMLNTRHT